MASFKPFTSSFSLFTFYLLLLLLSPLSSSATATPPSEPEPKMAYIIHTDNYTRPPQFTTQDNWYTSMLESVVESNSIPSILYTYDVVLHGFAAKLSAQEARNVENIHGVIGVYQDRKMQLHTTRSPDFLGLSKNSGLWPETNFGDGVIIGLVDTGIWPESDSFIDYELGPVGPEWKGECENGTRFVSSYCNNKLIGARFFAAGFEAMFGPIHEDDGEYMSPRDGFGHGTHTASTAAGAEVTNAEMFGYANGTARGIATKARIAAYKACWFRTCVDSDVLAAMEKAIEDGVHVLSISIGGMGSIPYYEDPIAIGAFAGVRKGIFVTCSAGNEGPSAVTNSAPWITTVGAGSLDRSFPAQVQLGNGELYAGQSLYNEQVDVSTMFPLAYLDYCSHFDITPDNVMGKIVVCDDADVYAGILVQDAGGAGLIALNGQYPGEGIIVSAFTLPALTVGYEEGQKIMSYMNSTNPIASLKSSDLTEVGKDRAPMVAYFSSTGPNAIVPELLKPDVLAPGFNILAAWVTDKAPTFVTEDPRRVKFNIISGTSMSCPHIAGVAALLRKAHPTWSPAAIRSALMTTSTALDNDFRPILVNRDWSIATPLDYGSGHVNPQMAESPGLIYDADIADYVNFLCTLNYTKKQLRSIVRGPISCSKSNKGPGQLNYPSFSVVFSGNSTIHVLTRTVTNVEELPENYTVRVINQRPDKVAILVKPRSLMFKQAYEKQSYSIMFKNKVVGRRNATETDDTESAHVIWESDNHVVRSPIVLTWKA
ncbi:subtilisin-like protease SBT1.8 [Magnolia sinica]|uniref:subtilisin-like protease SBT1.8 n=1 Tax=Magnolia sinica TaxID=86752 RepID=UPI002659F9BD|nr:subtilisin-like protease SBT1.8 [Magnolia sinica]